MLHSGSCTATLTVEGVTDAVESAREPGTDAYQEHKTYKQLVEELADELCRSSAGYTVPPAARGGGQRGIGEVLANRGWV